MMSVKKKLQPLKELYNISYKPRFDVQFLSQGKQTNERTKKQFVIDDSLAPSTLFASKPERLVELLLIMEATFAEIEQNKLTYVAGIDIPDETIAFPPTFTTNEYRFFGNTSYQQTWERFYTQEINNEKLLVELYLLSTTTNCDLATELIAEFFGDYPSKFFTLLHEKIQAGAFTYLSFWQESKASRHELVLSFLLKGHLSAYQTLLFDYAQSFFAQLYLRYIEGKVYLSFDSSPIYLLSRVKWIGDLWNGLQFYTNDADFTNSFLLRFLLQQSNRAANFMSDLPIAPIEYMHAVKIGLCSRNILYYELFEKRFFKLINDSFGIIRKDSFFGYSHYIYSDIYPRKMLLEDKEDLQCFQSEAIRYLASLYSTEIYNEIIPHINNIKLLGQENYLKLTSICLQGDFTEEPVIYSLERHCKPLPTDSYEQFEEQFHKLHLRLSDCVTTFFNRFFLHYFERYYKVSGLREFCNFFITHHFLIPTTSHTNMNMRYYAVGAIDVAWFRSLKDMFSTSFFYHIPDNFVSIEKKNYRFALTLSLLQGLISWDVIKNNPRLRKEEKLVISALLPLKNNDVYTLQQRYNELVTKFEAIKSIGSSNEWQDYRRAALENLAHNAGLSCIIHLELTLIQDVAHWYKFQAKTLNCDGRQYTLSYKNSGEPYITDTSSKRELSPKIILSEDTDRKLRSLYSELRSLHRTALTFFEYAMVYRVPLKNIEIDRWLKLPFLEKIISKLLFECNNQIGIYTLQGLKTLEGTIYPLKPEYKIFIAYPTQTLIEYCRKTQPHLFKEQEEITIEQLLRKIYHKNEPEAAELSYRFKGVYFEFRKTSILSKAGWKREKRWCLSKYFYTDRIYSDLTFFYLEKVAYKEESLVIDYVRFVETETNKTLPISAVPERIYSEVMRDIERMGIKITTDLRADLPILA
ncbi:MAG: DUF4132 domain-containing protein [Bacteroides sp.]